MMQQTYIAKPPFGGEKIKDLSAYEVAEHLIDTLRESNGLEFMPPEQRMALIRELSKDVWFSED